ncbi:MAG: hypothetical protein IH616_20485 [Gemmatimonadales bacterium]|jgi:hypothetical protein|nr:hypothetical protein [Gemmatimonadales bacterium]
MKRVVYPFAIALALLLPACSDSGSPSGQGSFSATVTGDLTLSFTGRAVFAIATQGANQGFAIALERQGATQVDRDVVVLARFNTQRPGVGNYSIVSNSCNTCTDDDFDAGYVLYRPSGDFGFFASESGTLTITESTAERVVGTLTFDASWVLSSDNITARDITITASFTAVPGTLPDVG